MTTIKMSLKKSQLYSLIISIRPGQWIKNCLLFTAIIFSGQLFNGSLFFICLAGFFIFCCLSSASYLVNDLIDLQHDQLHQQKKHRPLASGALKPTVALNTAIILSLIGLISSFLLSYGLFFLSLTFIIVHLSYSSFLKKIAVLDILAIASSFVIRTFAGEVLTGFHVPIWLLLSVVFGSLFIASGKRRSELVLEGAKTRPSLLSYRLNLLDFYTSTFANATLIAYALYTFFSTPPQFSEPTIRFLLSTFPQALDRKWLMALTIPFVIVGLMRYAQLVYEEQKGETPEKLLVSDLPLTLLVIGWGLAAILIIYVV